MDGLGGGGEGVEELSEDVFTIESGYSSVGIG